MATKKTTKATEKTKTEKKGEQTNLGPDDIETTTTHTTGMLGKHRVPRRVTRVTLSAAGRAKLGKPALVDKSLN